jgi:hypothetical protein
MMLEYGIATLAEIVASHALAPVKKAAQTVCED